MFQNVSLLGALKVVIMRWRINPFPNDRFYTLLNWKSLQITISSLMQKSENTVGKEEIALY